MSSASDNKAAFKRFVDILNTNDAALIDKTIDESVTPGLLFHAPVPFGATGPQALKNVMAALHEAFPDLHVAVDDLIAEDDKVVGRQTVTGTHRGDYMGVAPTGKSVRYNEIFIFRFAGDRVAEIWGVVDVLAQLKQLGAILS